jgi:LysM domain
VRKILLALLVAPAAATAQVPATDAPRTLDPGGTGAAPAPAPAPAAKPAPPAQPNVIVVGPDGKVSYDPAKGQAPSGYYMTSDNGMPVDSYDEPYTVNTGPTPELHIVRKGDTLWDISGSYFSDPWQWPKVWSYNPTITNPHWIYPGDLVRLLPRGMFAEQQGATPTPTPDPDGGGSNERPVDNLPAPAKSSSVGLKQTAFVEKTDLDKSITVDGSVDEKEMLAIGDSVYLSYSANNPPKVGQRYSVYKPDNTVKHDGKDVGSFVRIIGAVEVVSIKEDKRARGVIVESNQEIERGAKVGPLQKQFKNVTPVPPEVNAQGAIVAMLTKDQLIGQGEVVFVDLGKKSGVKVGNRLFVVRRGDALPQVHGNTVGQDDRRFPARALGEVVIVEVGENISIALVTLAVQEMSVGDIVMMQKQE